MSRCAGNLFQNLLQAKPMGAKLPLTVRIGGLGPAGKLRQRRGPSPEVRSEQDERS